MTGVITVCDFIIFIPFYSYYIPYIFSKSYLTIPILLFLSYPIAIFTFCGFSIFPALIYLKTQPDQIGEKEEFYQTLYQYCNQSKNKDEFDRKVILLNYLCLKTYMHKLAKNSEYYQFAKWLYENDETNVQTISMQEFQDKTVRLFDNSIIFHLEKRVILSLVNIKVIHVVIRTILMTTALSLDLFFFDTFKI
eukprot:545321_1